MTAQPQIAEPCQRVGWAGGTVTTGCPLPLGATLDRSGVNFAVFAPGARAMTLVLFPLNDPTRPVDICLDPRRNRTGDVWHVGIEGIGPGTEYAYRIASATDAAVSHVPASSEVMLLDPYARAVCGAETWGQPPLLPVYPSPWERLRPRRACVLDTAFDWGSDRPLHIPLADTVLYELHVRGFTQHLSSGVPHAGTFLGVVEKIPYLQELGVTAVELMPITEFEELDNPRTNPLSGLPLLNVWGYHPLALFAPKAAYAAHPESGGQVREFQTMVKALHGAGIEVILDLVFNHTGEGEEQFPTWSFRGLANTVYYLRDAETGAYANYSWCGNTLNCNHPVVQDMILDCLRYWVTEMHVDGFRFDLAAVLTRGANGDALEEPPLLKRISHDPVLARTKLIAEPWDAAGLYQVGVFPQWGRWAEWNDRFRDDIRRFVKSDPGMVPSLAVRLTGSGDLYAQYDDAPFRSINFVTSHDGFTLADLVSFNQKHNVVNGEHGRDGSSENFSWNCGEEGPSKAPEVCILRTRQMKNLACLLLMSQGVPMLLSGDEMVHTQQGNNNAYCHDNELSWLHWSDLECHADHFRFIKLLIAFRKRHAIIRRPACVTWHGCALHRPDWSWESRTLAMQLDGGHDDVDLYLIANAHWEAHRFHLPKPSRHKRWHRFVDTMHPPPHDIYAEPDMPRLDEPRWYRAGPRSVVVLIGT